jgi:hypothetical protein
MTHPTLALQKAIFAALIADAAVAALVGDRIYDAAPRDAAFPYLAFGPARLADWSTGSEAGSEHRFLVHAWSRKRGKRETFAIAEAVGAVLHDQSLELDGHALVNLRLETTDVIRDPDGITWHGVLRFRAVTEPA